MSSSLPASRATLAPPTWAGPRDECPGLLGGSLTFCSRGLLAGAQAMAWDTCGPTSVFREAGQFGGHSCSMRPCPQVCLGQGLAPRTRALSRTSACALGLGSSYRKEWGPWVLLTVRGRPSWEDTELAHKEGRRLSWKPWTPLSPGLSLLSISLWRLAPLLLHVGPLTLALSALSVSLALAGTGTCPSAVQRLREPAAPCPVSMAWGRLQDRHMDQCGGPSRQQVPV